MEDFKQKKVILFNYLNFNNNTLAVTWKNYYKMAGVQAGNHFWRLLH